MKISGKHYRTIWPVEDGRTVHVIDQTRLPFELAIRSLGSAEDAANAIQTMVVRGAPLIGVTAAYGLALAMRDDPSDSNLAKSASRLMETRPTAVNLRWALELMQGKLSPLPLQMRAQAGWQIKMFPSMKASASMAWQCCAIWPARNPLAQSSMCLHIATRDGWRQLTGEPPPLPFTKPMTKE
jgi:hypothetical protein